MEIVKGPRYKKVFVGGIPASVGEGEQKFHAAEQE